MSPAVMMVFYLLLALVISFTCSVLEAALLSMPRSFIKMLKDKGNKHAVKLEKLKDDIDNPIAAILTFNTFAHTIGASGVGAEAVKVFGESYLTIISVILTFIILIFSELIPKSIGAHYYKNMVGATSVILSWMVFLSIPFLPVAKFFMNLGKSKGDDEAQVSREEVSSMVNLGAEEGVLKPQENRMIQNLILFDSFKVSDIMTPRIACVTLSSNTKVKDFPVSDERFSRIPLWVDNEDNIVGIIRRDKVLKTMAADKFDTKLIDLVEDSLTVNDSMSVSTLFEKLLSSRIKLAIVFNEYGTFVGIATMEDVIETLLGIEIKDETDKVDDMRKYALEILAERQNTKLSKLNSHERKES